MRKAYIFLAAAPSVAMLVFWTGCAARQQQGAGLGDGGTNLAYMAEGTPVVTTRESASGTAPASVTAAPQRTAPQESFLYTVQPGDSLWKIANKHGTSVSLLQKMNNMPPDKITIRLGDKLMIPGKADAEKLRQVAAPSESAPTPVPTVTVPTTRTAAPASAPATIRTVTPVTAETPAPAITAPAATITTPGASITTPAATTKTPATTSAGASWLPPSYRTPQTGAATAPSVSTKTPSLTIAPGSATLSPSTVPATPSSPPPTSLTVPPTTITTPIGGMTLEAVGPTGTAPAQATPAPKQ